MDPYAVLGLDPGASLGDATRAYRGLAKQWHPDRAGAAGAARMIQLNVAYELLRSEHRRWTFSDLRPATAAAIAGHVRAGLLAGRG